MAASLGGECHADRKRPPSYIFVGVHFLRKRKSSLFVGVGEDAAIVARKIAAGRVHAAG
jgi:hypothetical protein